MSEIDIRITGRTGRITLNRPKALNAVSHDQIHALSDILPAWAADDDIAMVVIDAVGEKAFSAGGDIANIYAALTEGNWDAARQFWCDEYPVNAMLARFPKPMASFMQGFTMGGGVGVGCHVSHRIVGQTSRIAMPECGIGLIPDVGGTLLLANSPGHVGEYMGITCHRMGPGDAIFAGFADHYIPQETWPDLIKALEETGDANLIQTSAQPAPDSPLAAMQGEIDRHFAGKRMADILTSLRASDTDFAATTLKRLQPNAPLAMAATLALIRDARALGGIEAALMREYRFAYRIAEQGDFREGIRAAIIDKDKSPVWSHDAPDGVTPDEVAAILAPLGADELNLEEPQ